MPRESFLGSRVLPGTVRDGKGFIYVPLFPWLFMDIRASEDNHWLAYASRRNQCWNISHSAISAGDFSVITLA